MLMDAALRSKVGGSKSGAYEQVEQPYFYHYCCTGMNHSKVKEEKVTTPPPIQADSFPGKAHSPKTGSYSHSEAATEMKHSPHPPAPDRLCFCCHVSALPQLGSCPMDYISVA